MAIKENLTFGGEVSTQNAKFLAKGHLWKKNLSFFVKISY